MRISTMLVSKVKTLPVRNTAKQMRAYLSRSDEAPKSAVGAKTSVTNMIVATTPDTMTVSLYDVRMNNLRHACMSLSTPLMIAVVS